MGGLQGALGPSWLLLRAMPPQNLVQGVPGVTLSPASGRRSVARTLPLVPQGGRACRRWAGAAGASQVAVQDPGRCRVSCFGDRRAAGTSSRCCQHCPHAALAAAEPQLAQARSCAHCPPCPQAEGPSTQSVLGSTCGTQAAWLGDAAGLARGGRKEWASAAGDLALSNPRCSATGGSDTGNVVSMRQS